MNSWRASQEIEDEQQWAKEHKRGHESRPLSRAPPGLPPFTVPSPHDAHLLVIDALLLFLDAHLMRTC